MRLRTGKARQYRYYTCGLAADKGKAACQGQCVPEAILDGLVLESFADKVLTHERLQPMLGALIERTSKSRESLLARTRDLRSEQRRAARTRLGPSRKWTPRMSAKNLHLTKSRFLAGLQRGMLEASTCTSIFEELTPFHGI